MVFLVEHGGVASVRVLSRAVEKESQDLRCHLHWMRQAGLLKRKYEEGRAIVTLALQPLNPLSGNHRRLWDALWVLWTRAAMQSPVRERDLQAIGDGNRHHTRRLLYELQSMGWVELRKVGSRGLLIAPSLPAIVITLRKAGRWGIDPPVPPTPSMAELPLEKGLSEPPMLSQASAEGVTLTYHEASQIARARGWEARGLLGLCSQDKRDAERTLVAKFRMKLNMLRSL